MSLILRFIPDVSLNVSQVLLANSDSEGLVRIDLSPEIEATEIRIHPKKSVVQTCIRIEIIGCMAGNYRLLVNLCQYD